MNQPDEGISRRYVVTRLAGLAAVGAVGGALLTEALASPAAAATSVQTGAVAPTVVNLVDAPTVAVDASLGNDFRLTLGGNRTMGNPSNSVSGQQIIFQITQGAGAPHILTWGSAYEFSNGLPAPILSSTAGQTDLLGFIYYAANRTWLFAAFVNGFS
jgi:hypothetical protein